MRKLIFLLAAFVVMSCNSSKLKREDVSTDEALAYVTETRDLLMGTLMQKIKENGTENALGFCNVNALPLTQSVGDKHHVAIKRVSDKNRNPKNRASDAEMNVINQYKEQLKAGKALTPTKEGHYYYVPIVTNKACLQCHGSKEDNIKPATVQKIAELYPNDKATGYKENELRGLFVVDLKK